MSETVRLAWYCGHNVMHFDAKGNVNRITWRSNPRLSMTADEQWLHNRRSDEINGAGNTSTAHTPTPADI